LVGQFHIQFHIGVFKLFCFGWTSKSITV
jgi:hypothetical protein